ncbi:helix-turn-helix domain-containing protein [Flexivirga sp.]|uniref:helix-turn-helix domain-containing protein n=1 Tax=Flexivirga sp. TaxID=1962927 RepID=UPI003F822F5A
MSPNPVSDLGSYLKEQRQQAQLSLRQVADRAGISNPYLSQIERGLKRPSAEILQAIAKGLAISAEQLYVHAGILDALPEGDAPVDTRQVIKNDPRLTDKQRKALIDVYDSYVGD